jgi:hypothetical protein
MLGFCLEVELVLEGEFSIIAARDSGFKLKRLSRLSSLTLGSRTRGWSELLELIELIRWLLL